MTIVIAQLVASSTVGVAAVGLAFGRHRAPQLDRPTSKKRKATEYEGGKQHAPLTFRPATSPMMRTPVPEQGLESSPWSTSLPESHRDDNKNEVAGTNNDMDSNETGFFGRRGRRRRTLPSRSPPAEDRVESVSSRGSWYKRLSGIQLSQHSSSPRSSLGQDSSLMTTSRASGAPILHSPDGPAHLPPNKLVKRTPSGRNDSKRNISSSGNGSRARLPTLRRPATSRQRSLTLQQQYQRSFDDVVVNTPQHHSSPARLPDQPSPTSSPPLVISRWRHYFDSRSTRLTRDRLSERLGGDEALHDANHTSKRVLLPEDLQPPALLKPSMVLDYGGEDSYVSVDFGLDDSALFSDVYCTAKSDDIDTESHKRPKRSLSIHFHSPTTWISRTSSLRGSIRRGANDRISGKRYASAPMSSLPGRAISTSYTPVDPRRIDMAGPTTYQGQLPNSSEENSRFFTSRSSRARNNSSPLPPLSPLIFNLDPTRTGPSSSSSSDPRWTSNSPPLLGDASPPVGAEEGFREKSSSTVIVHQVRSPRVVSVAASDRASTLIGSDNELRDFASGEDDEMDFQSDTVFDSFRTGHTGSMRVRSPALESMFDSSPPSSYSKAKAFAISDVVTNAMNNERSERIMEEDEGMSTPIKSKKASTEDLVTTPTRRVTDSSDVVHSSPPSFCLATKDFSRLSLDDDEDEDDWTRDDDNDSIELANSLSPPKSSINSQRINPAIRMALADVTKTGSSSGNAAPGDERPKSVFDWSEPSTGDRNDALRPKTVHGKQGIDGRGGRIIGRRGPSVLHVRSQSVPVVPDLSGHREHTKLAPKFGTWGLGAKGVSEDWDNDFEFDVMDVDDNENGTKSMNSSMFVPPAIQASQANVVGHVGQIREVCLLVEDLKRLRGLAKEKELLHGSSASLWREAEGIIALAIPDEDESALLDPQSPEPPSANMQAMPPAEALEADLDDDNLGPTDIAHASLKKSQVRRRSVFSPDDDIFGTGALAETSEIISKDSTISYSQSTDVARTVMEHIHQHRVASDPLSETIASEPPKKMPFDTTSLRDLVQRASALARMLAEIIRKADGTEQSPLRSPQHKRERDSSPAFTRVFTDPLASPPKHISRSQSNNSMLNGSIDGSPTRSLGQRMHMMTVV